MDESEVKNAFLLALNTHIGSTLQNSTPGTPTEDGIKGFIDTAIVLAIENADDALNGRVLNVDWDNGADINIEDGSLSRLELEFLVGIEDGPAFNLKYILTSENSALKVLKRAVPMNSYSDLLGGWLADRHYEENSLYRIPDAWVVEKLRSWFEAAEARGESLPWPANQIGVYIEAMERGKNTPADRVFFRAAAYRMQTAIEEHTDTSEAHEHFEYILGQLAHPHATPDA